MSKEPIDDETDRLIELLKAEGFSAFDMTRGAEVRDGPVWSCKIGLSKGTQATLPGGADAPMRNAVEAAFLQVTGVECEFLFSGWGGELTEDELFAVEACQEH